MKINIGKLAGTVAKVAVPIIAVAVVTKTPLKRALEDAANKALQDRIDKAGV